MRPETLAAIRERDAEDGPERVRLEPDLLGGFRAREDRRALLAEVVSLRHALDGFQPRTTPVLRGGDQFGGWFDFGPGVSTIVVGVQESSRRLVRTLLAHQLYDYTAAELAPRGGLVVLPLGERARWVEVPLELYADARDPYGKRATGARAPGRATRSSGRVTVDLPDGPEPWS